MNYLTLKNIIVNKSREISNGILFFLILGIIYIISSDTLYESSISLYPAGELSDTNSMLSVLSEYTETFGVNFSNKSNYYIPDIVDSYNLKKRIVENNWKTDNSNQKINLIEYWDIDDDSFLEKIIDYIKYPFRGRYYDREYDNLHLAIEKLDKLISVNDAYSGLIEVNILFENPQIAADIGNFISAYVIEFVNLEQKKFASKTKEFTEGRFNLSEKDLVLSENNLTEFRKKNPIALDTPDLQLERLRLLRDLEVNQEVFITLRNQLEIAKIEESKERLFINILDKAEPSIYKSHPKIIPIIFIFLFIGTLFNVMFHVIRYNVKKK